MDLGMNSPAKYKYKLEHYEGINRFCEPVIIGKVTPNYCFIITK